MRNRLIALLLALTLALLPAVSLAEGSALGEKLTRQLNAGTGFSGTLTLTSTAVEGREAEAFATPTPIVVGVKFIQLRADALQSVLAERRLDLSLMEGDAATGSVSVAVRDGRAFLSGSVLGDGWYQLGAGMESTAAQSVEGALQSAAVPGVYRFLLPLLLLPSGGDNADLTEAAAEYATKIDLWLEGYRQGATLGQLEDGTATMDVSYQVPTAAVKAQLKQLVLDALSDQVLLLRLRAFLPDDEAARYLDPNLQSHYFDAIDALPLEGDFSLTRVCSLKGGTLKLSISLPFYDAQAGLITLRYERVAPLGDTPGTHSVRFESDALTYALDCTEYQTLTGATVFQGTASRQPHGAESYQVAEGDAPDPLRQPIACAFSLTYEAATAKTEDSKDQETYRAKLSLAPDASALGEDAAIPEALAFPAFDLEIALTLTSGRALNTTTAVKLEAALSGETLPQTVSLVLDGKTVSPWTPTAINELDAIDVSAMSADEQTSWLLAAGVQAAALLASHLQLPTAGASADAATDAPAETATDAPAETPAP